MDSRFCTECGATLDNEGRCTNPTCEKSKITTKDPKAVLDGLKTFSEKGKQIVPDCVKADLDEVPIRQYDIARLQSLIKGAFAEGRLQITNKRVLFRAVGNSLVGPTSLQYEFSIEEIAGIEIRKEARFNFLSSVVLGLITMIISNILSPIFTPVYSWGFVKNILVILLGALSVILFFILKDRKFARHIALSVVWAGLAMDGLHFGHLPSNPVSSLCVSVIMMLFVISFLFLAFAPNLVINIKTKGGTPSIEIRRKDGIFSFQHNDYTGFSQVLPGPDADVATYELGALIREIQAGTYPQM